MSINFFNFDGRKRGKVFEIMRRKENIIELVLVLLFSKGVRVIISRGRIERERVGEIIIEIFEVDLRDKDFERWMINVIHENDSCKNCSI